MEMCKASCLWPTRQGRFPFAFKAVWREFCRFVKILAWNVHFESFKLRNLHRSDVICVSIWHHSRVSFGILALSVLVRSLFCGCCKACYDHERRTLISRPTAESSHWNIHGPSECEWQVFPFGYRFYLGRWSSYESNSRRMKEKLLFDWSMRCVWTLCVEINWLTVGWWHNFLLFGVSHPRVDWTKR